MVRAKNVELAYIEEQSGEIVMGQSADYFGSSTDTKPTDKVVGGSTFIETDTGNFYYFDENSSTWVKKNESGGGGSSDFSTAEVTVITSESETTETAATLLNVLMPTGEINSNIEALEIPDPYTVVLIHGEVKLFDDEGDVINTTGNITFDSENNYYIITGDCTITVKKVIYG